MSASGESAGEPGPGDRLLRAWEVLSRLPAGDRLFSRAVGWMAPYSGSTGAVVRALEPGRCVVELAERRRVRNHLGSIHAVALLNVGELATGLATLAGMPPRSRGIVVELGAEYEKKARGVVRAECRSGSPPGPASVPAEAEEGVEHRAVARIRDDEDDLVASVAAVWLVSPREDG